MLLVVLVGLVASCTFLAIDAASSTPHVLDEWRTISYLSVAGMLTLPCLVGLAVGAPLVATDLQHATHRLVWSQDVTRLRWALIKLAVGTAVVLAPMAGLTLLVGWWATRVPIPHSIVVGGFYGRGVAPVAFDTTGPVIVAYALFAFAIGALLGAVVARPGWAFALGAAVVTVVRVLVQTAVRPHLATPEVLSNLTGSAPVGLGSAWILREGWLPTGRLSPAAGSTWSPFPDQCLSATQSDATLARCALRTHVHFVAIFQPASHYWALQAGESAIFVGASVLLAALSVLVVVRRSA
ncbi:MAG: hypothetical protein M0T80_03125 [Actinomycetota bacterium]|nr:hypothetical protein [Actinomycetota bacterium]